MDGSSAAAEDSTPDGLSPAHAKEVWRRLREHLEQRKADIAAQINNYPPPIPACDAQFNYLLEERGKLSEELNRLETARLRSLEQDSAVQGGGDGEAIAAFIAASDFIDG